ncbi:MAG TPA: phosphomannomutase/phosphoglucomutase [Oligoflexia bacterium]|nr:phosphomannomutase/phosphoglucomutase [Oligoflexia bacterium]HMP27696.1 phosphomannomutase/phosphoglucomutase [Oligoflexia bacterium]
MSISEKIFREYDIRGVVDIDLCDRFAFLLGRAFVNYLEAKGVSLSSAKVVIGYDARLSSTSYAAALAEGILSKGCVVAEVIGLSTTPLLYFAANVGKYDGAIMVTGSHNPANMNGFKICVDKSTISGSEIQDLKRLVLEEGKLTEWQNWTLEKELSKESGNPFLDRYIEELYQNVYPHFSARKLKVVVDAGNGVGGLTALKLLKKLNVEVVPLYCEPDGNFPNHHPDPTVLENLHDLMSKVKEVSADLGIGWDGDGDRIGVVDEKGRPVFGDMILLILAKALLKRVPNATIIGDVKCSEILFDEIKKSGGNPIIWKTGHSLIKNKLKETGGALAGEMSGHIFFKDRFYGFDDACYATLRLLEIVSNHYGPFSSLLAGLPETFSTPEIRVDCAEERKFEIANKAVDLFKDYQISTIDGVRIKFPQGWGLVRASNTQPVLVMRFEAASPDKLKEYQGLVMDRLTPLLN